LIRDISIAGTHRALLANMYDADAIEAINFEQLATITDRLLLRHSHRPNRLPLARAPRNADRFSVPSLIASQQHPRPARIASTKPGYLVSGPPRTFPRGSQPSLAANGFASEDSAEKTMIVRPRPFSAARTGTGRARSRTHWVAVTVVIPALLGTVAGLLMLL
jgi:hypothetical protein